MREITLAHATENDTYVNIQVYDTRTYVNARKGNDTSKVNPNGFTPDELVEIYKRRGYVIYSDRTF